MYRYAWRAMGLMAIVAGIMGGCEAPLPETPPESNEALSTAAAWAEWQTIAASDQPEWNIERAMELTRIMADSPSGLVPMILAIGDETVPSQNKVLIIICLTPVRDVVNPYTKQLIPMTKPDRNANVRAMATHVLGLADTPDAMTQVSALLNDEDRFIREAALGVLIAVHGDHAADQVESFWADPETSVALREQIVLGMSSELVKRFLPMFSDALIDLRLTAGARYKAATVLGQIGNATHIPVLQQCIDNDPDAYVRERAEGGLALLKARDTPASDAPTPDADQ